MRPSLSSSQQHVSSSSSSSSSSLPSPSSKQCGRKTYIQQSNASYSNDNDYQLSKDGINDNDNITDEFDDDAVSNSNSNCTASSQSQSQPVLLPSTYINIAPLPIFRGTPSECPLTHLSRFRRVCHANNASTLPSILRIFPVTLDDQAALWYDLNIQPHAHSFQSWKHMESAFLSAFLTPQFIEQARSDLMTLKQREQESVSMYYLRMQWLLSKWPENGLPDALLRGVFVDGLKEDFQDWVVLQRPETLEEAVRVAVNWEQVQSLRAKRSTPNKEVVVKKVNLLKCGFCDGGGHEEGECEVRRKMRELWMKRRDDDEEEEDHDGEAMERVMSLGRRAQCNYCQCWKHQCNWKSSHKLERSTSNVVVSQDRKISDIAN